MGKVNIKLDGNELTVDGIRYFENDGVRYFIYTLGDIDEKSYQTSYVTEIKEKEGQAISEENWFVIKDIMKKMIRENKLVVPSEVNDLNMSELDGINVLKAKPFKLPISSTNLLKAQNLKTYEIELETETDKDPVLSSTYAFDVEREKEEALQRAIEEERLRRLQELLEMPNLEPSKIVDFNEFEEIEEPISNEISMAPIEDFTTIESPLEEKGEEESLDDVNMNDLESFDFSNIVFDEDEEEPTIDTYDQVLEDTVVENVPDSTIENLKNLKTEVTKETTTEPIISKELASRDFKPMNPFAEQKGGFHFSTSKFMDNIYKEVNKLTGKNLEELPALEPLPEVKGIDLEEYVAPKEEVPVDSPSVDYEKLEKEIFELRKQISELVEKVGK